MVYPIVVYGHPVLRKVSQEIRNDYPDSDQLISDMFETMYRSEGMGLAAPQIGKSIRVFILLPSLNVLKLLSTSDGRNKSINQQQSLAQSFPSTFHWRTSIKEQWTKPSNSSMNLE